MRKRSTSLKWKKSLFVALVGCITLMVSFVSNQSLSKKPLPLPAKSLETHDSQTPEGVKIQVTKCHDGDTCRVKTDQGMMFAVRLAGIDAPEVAARKGCGQAQPKGVEAKELLATLTQGKSLTMKQVDLDRYNRPVVELFDGTENINLKMVSTGLAEAYKDADPKKIQVDLYAAAESQAKASKLGIWSISTGVTSYESPKTFRARGANKACHR